MNSFQATKNPEDKKEEYNDSERNKTQSKILEEWLGECTHTEWKYIYIWVI